MFGRPHTDVLLLQQCSERWGDEAGQIRARGAMLRSRSLLTEHREPLEGGGQERCARCSLTYITQAAVRRVALRSGTAGRRKSEWEVACTPRQAMIGV